MATQRKNLLLLVVAILAGVSLCYGAKYEYDSLNRLSEVIYDDGTRLVYNYDDSGNRSQRIITVLSDLDGDGIVNFTDFTAIATQWLQEPGEPSADIAPWPDTDNFVDMQDLARFAQQWLESL